MSLNKINPDRTVLILADSKIPNAEAELSSLGVVRVLHTRDIKNQNIREADAILVRSETKVDASLLDGTRVRFVGTATIGTDHVNLEYLRAKGIAFASCPGSNANSVSEYILAALLELSHRFGFSLHNKTLGIVGHGNTGSRSARKAAAIGMRVMLNDPPLARQTDDPRYVPLDALMDADIISLHVPLTFSGEDATCHLFDEKRISAMKPGSILVNASRGSVVETNAVKRALTSKHLRACVLDVWEGEPSIDIDLLKLVALASPHIAGYSFDGKLNATMILKQALADHLHLDLPSESNRNVSEPEEIDIVGMTFDLRTIVKRCYDIEEDDRAMRRLTEMPEAERADYFRLLRAHYRVRREFHNFAIREPEMTESEANMLRELGFFVP